jgi:hypothetical protein
MSKKRINVDAGTMHLPVGEDNLSDGEEVKVPAADSFLISRFRDALDGRRSAPTSELVEEELESPFALLGAPEPVRQADASEIGSAIERLWVGDGASGLREVRVKLGSAMLPGTSVRLYEAAGRLYVDLVVDSDEVGRWLRSRLPALGRDLSERLQRPVRVAVVGAGDDAGMGVFEPDWPEASAR